MQIPEARWIVFGTLLLFAMMLAWYVVSYFRNLAFGSDSDESTELLTGFRQMRDEGQLADDEFSRLKTAIPDNENGVNWKVTEKVTKAERNTAGEQVDQPAPEKKYLTLAEAQELRLRKQAGNDEGLTPNTTNHEDEAKETE